ncbi:pyridoxal kinase PdxY [Polycladidibacter stylochi]|uniref:pyridoxal kinase PdxY n=1 Tax=Polycladidibacter stylochi TaxID=1807766 RepID=UPI0008317A99|nr:pyridoxal kinase PdxY [Pseudovibrio stylochi]
MKGVLSIQSHVTYGHAGNSCAVFPMQRSGLEVWPIYTVQFSNHTQYPQGWTGRAMSGDEIREVFNGLCKLECLSDIKAIVTGYLGAPGHSEVIADIVKEVKQHNPDCLFVCDPVMGDPAKGCIVSDGVAENLIDILLPMADVIVPNQYELTQFTGVEINSLQDVKAACTKAHGKGPQTIVAKHLHSLSDQAFSMALSNGGEYYLAQRPHLPFERQPVGVGDLISALYTAGVLNEKTPQQAFEHLNNAVYGVLKATKAQGEWELQTIAAQEELVAPTASYKLEKF